MYRIIQYNSFVFVQTENVVSIPCNSPMPRMFRLNPQNENVIPPANHHLQNVEWCSLVLLLLLNTAEKRPGLWGPRQSKVDCQGAGLAAQRGVGGEGSGKIVRLFVALRAVP